jgi:hypothetical protein
MIIEDSGAISRALQHLLSVEKFIVDKKTALEAKGSLGINI